MSPGEGCEHFVLDVSSPGLEWSEGWATFHGQWALGVPIFFEVKGGGAFWIDMEAVSTCLGCEFTPPSPGGGIDQCAGGGVAAACHRALRVPNLILRITAH